MSYESSVTASDWIKGISLSVLASVIGGASKLAIRKSWLLEQQVQQQQEQQFVQHHNDSDPIVSIGSYNHQVVVEVMPDMMPDMMPAVHSPLSQREDDLCDGRGVEPSPEEEFLQRHAPQPGPLRQRLSVSLSRDSSLGEVADSSNNAPGGNGFPVTTAPEISSTHPVLSSASSTSSSASSISNPASPQRRRSSRYSTRQIWAYVLRFLGMIGMTFLNPLCGVLAMNFASPSILAPFSGLTLVWIILWSGPLLGEAPSGTQVKAAFMILLGEIVVALYGDHTSDSGLTANYVLASYREPLFILYLVVLLLWMVLLFHWMKHGSRRLKRFAWGISGGSITGLQNFLKDALTILKSTRSSKNHSASSSPQYHGLVLFFGMMAIFAAFSGLALLTACMKRYDVTYTAAMFVGSFVISASIMSAIHYDTFAHLQTVSSYVMYPLGLLVLMGGVYVLVQESHEGESSSTNLDVGGPMSTSPRSSYSNASTMSRGQSMVVLDAERLVPKRDDDHGVFT